MVTRSNDPTPASANEFIEHQLDERILTLEEAFSADVVAYSGLIVGGVDDLLRGVIEGKRSRKPDRTKLVVCLTTAGGYIEVVQRIAETLRHHYDYVEYVIPDFAFSAGTVLVMSGDAIHMDYYSRLGPIDPQVPRQGGSMVPALGYLIRYERLLKKARDGTITLAEIQLLIDGFDQAELYKYEQARELSITLLKDWLANYKFRNWEKTETRKMRVTKRMRTQRAASIARKLNNPEKWHSHGYGISMDVLRRDLQLKVDDFGKTPMLSEKIRAYHDLLEDYTAKRGIPNVVHNNGVFIPIQIQ